MVIKAVHWRIKNNTIFFFGIGSSLKEMIPNEILAEKQG
jgi:hypothetical protein